MRVEVWSDVVCPWCYVGKRHLEAALEGFAHRDEVEVVWRSFELDPSAPPVRTGSYRERIARKYGVSPEEADATIARITAAGARAGLELRFDRLRAGNTFDAHQVVHLGKAHGVQDAVKERLFAATFVEGAAIGERDVLVRLAADLGLDAAEVEATLASDRLADEVREAEAAAATLDIYSVPTFVVDRRVVLPGAQPPELIRRVLERARAA